MNQDDLMEEARRLAAVAHSQTELVLDSASDAERGAAEYWRERHASPPQTEVVWIDWASGARVSADVIPFPTRPGRRS